MSSYLKRLTGASPTLNWLLGIAGVAYVWVGFSPDPLAMVFIPAALLLGIVVYVRAVRVVTGLDAVRAVLSVLLPFFVFISLFIVFTLAVGVSVFRFLT